MRGNVMADGSGEGGDFGEGVGASGEGTGEGESFDASDPSHGPGGTPPGADDSLPTITDVINKLHRRYSILAQPNSQTRNPYARMNLPQDIQARALGYLGRGRTPDQALREARVDDWEAQMRGLKGAGDLPLTDTRAELMSELRGEPFAFRHSQKLKKVVADARAKPGFKDLSMVGKKAAIRSALRGAGVDTRSTGLGLLGSNLKYRGDLENIAIPALSGVGTIAGIVGGIAGLAGKAVMGQVTDDKGNTFNVHEDGSLSPSEVEEGPETSGAGAAFSPPDTFNLAQSRPVVAAPETSGAMSPEDILKLLINQQFIERDPENRFLSGAGSIGGQARRTNPLISSFGLS